MDNSTKTAITNALIDMRCFVLEETNNIPLLSEEYLYNTIGKNDARSFLYHFDNLARAIGIDPFVDVVKPANIRLNNSIYYSYKLKFKNEDDAIEFTKLFRDWNRKNLVDGDVVPRISKVVNRQDSDIGKPTTHSDTIPSELEIMNVTRTLNKFITKIMNGNDDITIVDTSSYYDLDMLQPKV